MWSASSSFSIFVLLFLSVPPLLVGCWWFCVGYSFHHLPRCGIADELNGWRAGRNVLYIYLLLWFINTPSVCAALKIKQQQRSAHGARLQLGRGGRSQVCSFLLWKHACEDLLSILSDSASQWLSRSNISPPPHLPSERVTWVHSRPSPSFPVWILQRGADQWGGRGGEQRRAGGRIHPAAQRPLQQPVGQPEPQRGAGAHQHVQQR